MPDLLDRPATVLAVPCPPAPAPDQAPPDHVGAPRQEPAHPRQDGSVPGKNAATRFRRELMAWVLFFGLLAIGTWLGRPDTTTTPWTDTLEAVCLIGVGACMLVGPGSLLFDVARTLLRSPRPRRWLWLRAAVAAVAFTTTLDGLGLDAAIGCGGGPNAGLRQQASQIQVALEDYAEAHGGRYPARDRWIAELTAEPGPLHGQALPKTRWGTAGQTAVLAPAALGLPGADQPAAIANVPPMEIFPGGQPPHGAPSHADDFGAVLYDYDLKSQTYVLYVVGKRYRHAELVATFTNADLDAVRIGPPQPDTIPDTI